MDIDLIPNEGDENFCPNIPHIHIGLQTVVAAKSVKRPAEPFSFYSRMLDPHSSRLVLREASISRPAMTQLRPSSIYDQSIAKFRALSLQDKLEDEGMRYATSLISTTWSPPVPSTQEKAIMSRANLLPRVVGSRPSVAASENNTQGNTSKVIADPHALPLLAEDAQHVYQVISKGNDVEIISENPSFSSSISRGGIKTLSSNTWLNDEVINYYLSMISSRSKDPNADLPAVHFFNTFFYSKLTHGGYSYDRVRRWAKKIDLFGLDMLLVPIHDQSHWVLGVIYPKERRISIYDALRTSRRSSYLENLQKYIFSEAKERHINAGAEWKLEADDNIPVQTNSYDCGVFVCKYAERISVRAQLNFHQSQMANIRQHIASEIIRNRIGS